MLADLLTTEIFDGRKQTSLVSPDPEWPAIVEAFRRLDGEHSSWMTIVQGERQMSIGGGRRGYVVVAEDASRVLRGASEPSGELELWVNGRRRDCPAHNLLSFEHVLQALKAFVLAGMFSPQLNWQG